MHSRFLFDADFSLSHLHSQEDRNVLQHPRSDLEKAEYERGVEDGRAAAIAESDLKTVTLLEQIVASLEMIRQESQSVLRDIEKQLTAVAADLTLYLTAELDPIDIMTKPQFGVANMIEKAGRNSQLTLILAPEDAKHLRERLLGVDLEIATIQESASVSSGQFELRWPEGGVIFDKHRLEAAYAELLEHYRKG